MVNKEQVKGKVKEGKGKLTGDHSKELEGKVEGALGKAKEKVTEAVDDVSEKVNETIDKIKDKKHKE